MLRQSMLLCLLISLGACETTAQRVPDADAVSMFVGRADACAHWSTTTATDPAEQTEIENARTALRCSTLVRDGEALKVSRRDRPEDLARIDAALAPRP